MYVCSRYVLEIDLLALKLNIGNGIGFSLLNNIHHYFSDEIFAISKEI